MYASDIACRPACTIMPNDCTGKVDFIESGAGPLVVLVHSSMSGARQWSTLVRDLETRMRIRAVNLFGYGGTPAWSGADSPTLEDYAELVASAVPSEADNISLVGHSFGGAVAMHAAAFQLTGRVKNLVLIEPSLFYLLDRCGCGDAFSEISALADHTKQCITNNNPQAAAESFIDYWCGDGTWAASSAERKATFARSINLLMHEWNAVLSGTIMPAEWAAALPRNTLAMASATTVRPSRELVDLLLDALPDLEFASIRDGGHMSPLTHPQLVNPIIREFLG